MADQNEQMTEAEWERRALEKIEASDTGLSATVAAVTFINKACRIVHNEAIDAALAACKAEMDRLHELKKTANKYSLESYSVMWGEANHLHSLIGKLKEPKSNFG